MVSINLSFLIPLILLVIISLSEVSREVSIRSLASDVDDDVYLLHGGPFERVYRGVVRRSLKPGEMVADRLAWTQAEGDDKNENSSLGPEEPDRDSEPSPSFGRFNHLHGFNTFLLSLAMILIALVQADLTGVVLALIVAVFWMNLPAIEVNEYDLMLRVFNSDDRLDSLSFHTFAVGLSSIPLIIFSYIDISTYRIEARVIGGLLFVIASVLISNFYQSLLDNEMQRLAEYEDSEQM